MRAQVRRAEIPTLSPDDLARLRRARGREVDPTRSLYGPETVTWRVNRETTLLLGGGRALLLQVAHPLVAAGVARYSDFRSRPLHRLWRTLDLMLTIVFADATSALRAVREIERVHARVHGVLDADVGPFPRGTAWDANDPALLFWVWATLVDTALLVYERFVGALSDMERVTYYEESKIGARLLGMPDSVIPPTIGAFGEYVAGMLAGETLAVGPAGRDIAGSILDPPLPIGLRQLAGTTALVTVGLLPASLRARYGLAWDRTRETALRAVSTATRASLPLLPGLLRFMPHARRAARRHG